MTLVGSVTMSCHLFRITVLACILLNGRATDGVQPTSTLFSFHGGKCNSQRQQHEMQAADMLQPSDQTSEVLCATCWYLDDEHPMATLETKLLKDDETEDDNMRSETHKSYIKQDQVSNQDVYRIDENLNKISRTTPLIER